MRIVGIKNFSDDTSLLNAGLSESVQAGFGAVSYYVTF